MLGFEVWGLGFHGLVFGALRFRLYGLGFRVWDLGFWVFGFVVGLGFRVSDLGFRVWGFGFAEREGAPSGQTRTLHLIPENLTNAGVCECLSL
jgi:hypothetical protein